MPLTAHGRRVRRPFHARYGPAMGERIFYATANSAGHGSRDRIGGQPIHPRRTTMARARRNPRTGRFSRAARRGGRRTRR